jgi:hypothetical protein
MKPIFCLSVGDDKEEERIVRGGNKKSSERKL